MELRSSRVLKRGKASIGLSVENGDSLGEKGQSLNSDKSPSVKKGTSEDEIKLCVDNADEDLEMSWINGSRSVILEGTKDSINMDDKGLFLGSEVLDPIKDLVASCAEGEMEEVSVERVQVECSVNHTCDGGEEGNKPVSVNWSDMDPDFKEERKSSYMISTDRFHLEDSAPTSSHVKMVDCKNGSEYVESGTLTGVITVFNGDEDKETSAAVLDSSSFLNDSGNADAGIVKSRTKKGKGRHWRKKKNVGNLKKKESNCNSGTTRKEIKVEETAGSLHVECQEKADVGSSVDGGECTLALVKCKRGRKRKNVESSGCNADDIAQVSGRVLRSRTMTVSGGSKVVDSGLSGTVVGLKRMARTELQTGVDESSQLSGRPKKKLKRRGRPPKVQAESSQLTLRPKKKLKRRGRPPKVQGETISHEIPKKKLKRRGRPPKVQYETMLSHEIPSISMKCQGSPPKVQGKEIVSLRIQKNRHKDMMLKKLKRRGRPPKMEARNLATHVIKMRTMKLMAVKKSNSQLKAKDVKKVPKIQKVGEDGLSVVTGENPQKVQQSEENSEHMMTEDTIEGYNAGKGSISGQFKQLVKDQIIGIFLEAGWKIDHRPRPERTYRDAVYIEPTGRTHWSITKAYSILKKKIENGDADSNEVSAFTPIPEEEMSMLYRPVNRVRSNNNKNKMGKDARGKKKPGKKRKDGSKQKMIWNSAARLANKSKNVKLRGDKSHREHGITAESSLRGQSRLGQEGNQSRKPRLLARSSEKGSNQDNDGCLEYSGKCNLLSWMIDLGVILPGWKVQYGKTRRQKKSSEGTITSGGIHCSCCNGIMGISEFVAHAGGKLSQPFHDIYLESGTSLLKCLLDSWRREQESNTIRFNLIDVKGDDPNDDTCNICGDGGNLICCDGCPSTFHQSCLDIENFPSGDWNCIYCSCKFCGVVSVSAPQVNGSHDALISKMLSCCLCEEKFHQLCLQEVEAVNVDSSRLRFCGRKCQELFEQLQTCLGVKFDLEDGFSWTLLQRSDVGQDFTLHDTQLKVECNSKLAVAFSVMDECFVPIVDERSGTSIIHNVVYNCGSNFRRLNYAGFLTAILEKGDELITAASIRIHGCQLAEMPFIGTRHMYRRQGMCRRLLDAIESTLSSLGVEELIIPAIPELLHTWTKAFGFVPLEESKRQAMKFMSMLVFPGIDMLQKSLLQNQSDDKDPSPSAASDDKAVECVTEPNDRSNCPMSSNAIDYEQRPTDAAGVGKDAINYEQTEEATVVMDGYSCLELNDKSVSQLETMSSNTIGYKQRPADAAGVKEYAIDYEQMEEATVLMDGYSYPELNDKSFSQFETMSSDAIDYKQRPADAAGVRKDAIDYEQTEEATLSMDGYSCPKLNDTSISRFAVGYKERAADAAGVGKDAIDYEQAEEAIVLMDGYGCPGLNAKSVSPFETMSSNAIGYKQWPANAAGVGKDAIGYEQTEEATVLMGAYNCHELNDKSDSQFETMSSDAIGCKLRPADAAGAEKDAIDHEQTEEATVSMDSYSCPELNDKTVSQFETMSSNAIGYKQRPANAAGVAKDATDYEQTEEATVLMDGCSCLGEDATHLENDKLITSHSANSLYDLNFPVNNVTCQVPETTGLISCVVKSDIQMQHVPSDADVQPPDGSVAHELSVVAFVKSEQLPPSEFFPHFTIQPSSMASVTCGLRQSPESELVVENDDIPGAKASPLTFKSVPKNTFDLNLHPTAIDTDLHIIGDNSLPSDPQSCTKSFDLSDSMSQIENNAGSLPDSQPLVLL